VSVTVVTTQRYTKMIMLHLVAMGCSSHVAATLFLGSYHVVASLLMVDAMCYSTGFYPVGGQGGSSPPCYAS
jgi:hypothetical protein